MRLTVGQLAALLPGIMLGVTAITVMLLTAFSRRREPPVIATIVGLLLSFAMLPIAGSAIPEQVTPLLRVDAGALFYTGLVLSATFCVALLAAAYLARRGETPGEFFVLLCTAAFGGVVLASASHFASLFLGFELLSVSLFALLAYSHERRPGLEAGAKYLVLSGVSSAFLLFGIALIYFALGTLDFAQLPALGASGGGYDTYLTGGLALFGAGLAFKLSLAPFHLWTPDVYQGAPAPVTAFLATVSKGAVFIVLLRYFTAVHGYAYGTVLTALTVLACASMLLGNVLALLQQNVKRILAYSSIAHLGYLIVTFIAGGPAAVESASFYLAAYFASTIGAFGVVTVLSSGPDEPDEVQMLERYRGLFWRRPWLAAVFTLMLLSLAGIPLTIGFMAKFYVVAASIQGALWVLLSTVIIGSAIGLFYYLRVVVTMYLGPEEPAPIRAGAPVSVAGGVVLTLATAFVIWLGVYPAPLIELIRNTTFSLL